MDMSIDVTMDAGQAEKDLASIQAAPQRPRRYVGEHRAPGRSYWCLAHWLFHHGKHRSH
jgi:hypothetical protein